MTNAIDYRPREYWAERIAGDGNLANVGQVALGAYNGHAYPFRLAALERGIAGLAPERPRVFDGGFGEGIYLRFWEGRGAASLAGLDFSSRAVAAANAAHRGDFRTGDLSRLADFGGFGPADVVTAIDVLYHVVDDTAWRRAIRNLVGLVDQAGSFVFTDKFPRQGAVATATHVRRRSVALWSDALAEHGFEIVRRVPVFVLMDDPITCGSHPLLGRLARLQWRVAGRLIRSAAGRPERQRRIAATIAAVQAPFERLLVRRLRSTPNLELAVARRRERND